MNAKDDSGQLNMKLEIEQNLDDFFRHSKEITIYEDFGFFTTMKFVC